MAIFGGSYMDDMLPPSGADNSGDDILWGGMGADALSGGAGNDRLEGGPGADDLDGGPGRMDVASYRNSDAGVKVDLSDSFVEDDDDPGPVFGGHAEGDTLRGIESLWGSDFSDKLLGNHTANYLFGFDGNDIIMGARGNDLLRGQDGDDQLSGDSGDDTLYGDTGGDLLEGGAGSDLLRGGEGIDALDGGVGNDVLEGGPDGDQLSGGDFMDVDGMVTNRESDTAAYTMSSEAVTVDLRYQTDPTKQAPMGGDALDDMLDGIENLRGSMYDDVLIGDGYKNKLFGNMGDDMLKGMGDADTLHGGKGMDTLYGGTGNDTLRGEMGDDALKGDGGSDTLVGGPGADKLFGGSFDAETMTPGADDADVGGMMVTEGRVMVMGDTADYSMSDAGVHISLIPDDHDEDRETPENIVGKGGHAEGDVLVAIENLTGSAYTDMLEGSDPSADGEKDGDNVLMGGDGDDWDNPATPTVTEGGLFGMGGNDTLAGGNGMDLLEGGEGEDDLWGGAGNDLIKGGGGADFSIRGATAEEAADTDLELELGDDVRVAKTYADLTKVPVMDGGAAANAEATFVRAGLYGGAGDDTLMGGDGADYIDGGSGSDTADYSNDYPGEVGVVVDLRRTPGYDPTPDDADSAQQASNVVIPVVGAATPMSRDNVASHSIGDVLRGIENVKGSSDNDTIIGNNKDNVITGNGGGDQLWGLGGADTFVFSETEPGSDTLKDEGATIMDFSSREGDQIDLSPDYA